MPKKRRRKPRRNAGKEQEHKHKKAKKAPSKKKRQYNEDQKHQEKKKRQFKTEKEQEISFKKPRCNAEKEPDHQNQKGQSESESESIPERTRRLVQEWFPTVLASMIYAYMSASVILGIEKALCPLPYFQTEHATKDHLFISTQMIEVRNRIVVRADNVLFIVHATKKKHLRVIKTEMPCLDMTTDGQDLFILSTDATSSSIRVLDIRHDKIIREIKLPDRIWKIKICASELIAVPCVNNGFLVLDTISGRVLRCCFQDEHLESGDAQVTDDGVLHVSGWQWTTHYPFHSNETRSSTPWPVPSWYDFCIHQNLCYFGQTRSASAPLQIMDFDNGQQLASFRFYDDKQRPVTFSSFLITKDGSLVLCDVEHALLRWLQ